SNVRFVHDRYQSPGDEERATSFALHKHRNFQRGLCGCVPPKRPSRRRRELSPRALDWRSPREVIKPPARWVFNALHMNSIEKRSRCLSMNWIISDVVGRVLMRKKPMRLSTTHSYREALDSHGAAWQLQRLSLR